jgi:hypothetical protein
MLPRLHRSRTWGGRLSGDFLSDSIHARPLGLWAKEVA